MKFLYAVVMLALVFGAQASVIPWAAHAWGPWNDGSWHGDDGSWHGDDGSWHGDDGSWHGDAWSHGAWGHGPVLTPGIGLAQGPHWGHHGLAVAVHAPAVAVHAGHGHDAGYVAKTRGAVHTAPLAGHIASVSSVNVAPAPGTH